MIVYAPSFAGLVQSLKIEKWDHIKVLSSNSAIIDFCKINDISHHNLGLRKPTNRIEIQQQKTIIDQLTESIIGEEILFCFYGFDIIGLYFMYRLKRRNNVMFYNKDHNFKSISMTGLLRRKRELIDFLVNLKELKIIFNYFIIDKNRGFFGIEVNRLEKDFSPIKSNVDEEKFEYNTRYFSSKLNLSSEAIIFVDQGKTAFEVSDSVVDFILSKFEFQNFYVKAHPNFPISNDRLLEFKQIPSYIPLDLVMEKNMQLIGVCSTVLLDANVKNIYSIIDKVKWREESTYNHYKSIINQSEKIILL
jgi:hypothetical protein